MFYSFLTPRVIGFALLANMFLLSLLYVPAIMGLTGRFRVAEALIMTTAGVLAFGITLILSLHIAGEYRQSPWARYAWLLLAANACLSLMKKVVGSPLLDFVIPNYGGNPMRGLLENIMIVPANFCLLAGLLALWWAIHEIGLGFKISKSDYLAMILIAGVFFTLIIIRKDLSQGQSPFYLGRLLQPLGLVLLGFCSAFCVVLHRYAMQMGDSTLAIVMRWLMVYVLLRGVLVLGRGLLSPNLPFTLDAPNHLGQWTYDVLWEAVHWSVALATVYRAQLTVHAARQLRSLRTARAETLTAEA